MNTIILISVVIVTVASATKPMCKPGSRYKDYCNTCSCSNDGLSAACTLMACDKNIYNKDGTIKGNQRTTRSIPTTKKCKPRSHFKEYCNYCVCSDDGLGYACTRMACDMNIYNKDGSLKAPLICEPGISYYDYCNICVCSNDGLSSACTRKACDKRIYNKDGSLKHPYQNIEDRSADGRLVCEPGKPFKLYCNQCACADDGSSYACTKMYCDKRIFNKDGSLKIETESNRVVRSAEEKKLCKPGRRFKKYCNDCVCSRDGTTYACTEKACDKRIYNRDGSLKKPYICEPGKSFMDYCNHCVCGPEGLTKACTDMACDPNIYNEDGSRKKSRP